MGVLDKFLDVMKLNADDDEDFYEEDYYDEEEEEEPVKKRGFRRKAEEDEDDIFNDKPVKEKTSPKVTSSKVTPIRSKRTGGPGGMVCVIKPTSVDDAREITETLLDGRTIILNVEGLDVDIAQRIIDFSSGSCYAINGNLQKVSHYIFVITPQNVEISGDILNLMDAFDSSLQTDF